MHIYLVEKYPLPHTLPIAKRTLQLLPHLHTLYSSYQPSRDSSEIDSGVAISNIVENVGRICGAFPVLAEDAVAILLDMAEASSMALPLPPPSPFKTPYANVGVKQEHVRPPRKYSSPQRR